MAGWTNYGERKLLGVLLGTVWNPVLTLRLGTNAGTDEEPVITEVSGGGYAPVSLSAGLWSAATSSTYTYAPCGGGGFTYHSSRANLASALTFPTATSAYDFDSIYVHDGTDVVAVRPGAGPVDPGYRVKVFATSVQLSLDFSSSVACPSFLNRGTVPAATQRKLLDSVTGVAPWTPTPYLAIRKTSAPTEQHFVDTSGLWDTPATDGSGRAASALSTTVSLGPVTNGFTPLALDLTDGASYTTHLGLFGFTAGTGPPALAAGDTLRVQANRIIMRIAD